MFASPGDEVLLPNPIAYFPHISSVLSPLFPGLFRVTV